MLDDLEDGQVYVMRNLKGSIALHELDRMTRPQLMRWIDATSRIIRRELGKNADDAYDDKPEEYWESGPRGSATVERDE